jgi:hypothetical protein
VVAHTCNPSYPGGRARRTTIEGQPRQKVATPYLKSKLKAKKDGDGKMARRCRGWGLGVVSVSDHVLV